MDRTGVFVGRERELTSLRAAWQAALAGDRSTVLVGGDAGAGKTTLLAAFTRDLDADPLVLVGHCLQVGAGSLPFAPFTEAFRELVAGIGEDRARRLIGPAVDEVGRLIPSLRGAAREAGGEVEGAARVRLFDGVLRLLSGAAEQRPLLLVLEDLHWADASTRELLAYLRNGLDEVAALVAATFRTDELHRAHPLLPFVAELGRAPDVARIDLSPLSRDEVAELATQLLGEVPDRAAVDRVLARAGGNPFFTRELLTSGALGDGELPPTLRDSVQARMADLAPEDSAVLRVAAAVGREVQPELLARGADVDPGTVDRAMLAAMDLGLIELSEDGSAYRFRHALLAEAVHALLLPGERTRVHRALAQALSDDPSLSTGAPAAEQAHHWTLARDLPRAFESSVAAVGEAIEVRAYGEAAEQLDRVIDLWDVVDDATDRAGADRVETLARAAEVSALAGRLRRAVALVGEAIAWVDGDEEPGRLGELLLRRARYIGSSHLDAAQAHEDVARALALLPDEPPSAARARALMAANGAATEGDAEAIARSERALEIARVLGDGPLEGEALAGLGYSLTRSGRRAEGLERLRHAAAVADSHGLGHLRARADQYHAATLIYDGRASAGADVALAGLERARRAGLGVLHGANLAGTATSGLFLSGRWDDAEDLLAELQGDSWGTVFLATLQARLAAFRGDLDRARALLDPVGGLQRDPSGKLLSVELALAVFAGDLDRAHDLVTEALHRADRPHAGTVNELVAWALRIEADRLAAGAPAADVRPAADRLVAELLHLEDPMTVYAEPWRLTALAEHARVTGEDPVTAWEAAVEAWQRIGWPYPVAYASLRLAEARLDADVDGDTVHGLLEGAAEAAVDLRARPLEAHVRAVARRTDLRLPSTREAPDAVADLTPREVEVLTLVADGRTNREIGEELFISQKTASVHVSNILRKLEVSSRTEAATTALRLGLVPDRAGTS